MTAPTSIDNLGSDYEIVDHFQGDRFSYTTPWVVRHKPTGVLYASVFGYCNWWTAEVEETERTSYSLDTSKPSTGPRSPKDVAKDKSYEELRGIDWHRGEPHVVRVKRTGELWGCFYAVRDDDSDWDQPQRWFPVVEKKVVEKTFKYKADQALIGH